MQELIISQSDFLILHYYHSPSLIFGHVVILTWNLIGWLANLHNYRHKVYRKDFSILNGPLTEEPWAHHRSGTLVAKNGFSQAPNTLQVPKSCLWANFDKNFRYMTPLGPLTPQEGIHSFNKNQIFFTEAQLFLFRTNCWL